MLYPHIIWPVSNCKDIVNKKNEWIKKKTFQQKKRTLSGIHNTNVLLKAEYRSMNKPWFTTQHVLLKAEYRSMNKPWLSSCDTFVTRPAPRSISQGCLTAVQEVRAVLKWKEEYTVTGRVRGRGRRGRGRRGRGRRGSERVQIRDTEPGLPLSPMYWRYWRFFYPILWQTLTCRPHVPPLPQDMMLQKRRWKLFLGLIYWWHSPLAVCVLEFHI